MQVGLTDGAGDPLGIDFVNYWAGPVLAWSGQIGQVYDRELFNAFQRDAVQGTLQPYYYSYPPVMLVLTAPLALLPYVAGYGAWLAAGWLALWRSLRLIVPRGAWLAALAAPAVFVTAVTGQNGMWTAALLGGGVALLDRRPVLAGILFGLMCFKPQLALLAPVAVIAGGRWRAFASAALTVAVLLAISLLLWGQEPWHAYAASLDTIRAGVLERSDGFWHRMASVMLAVRWAGLPVEAAYAVQALCAGAAVLAVAWLWWKDAPAPIRCAAVMVGTAFATPYLFDYDLVMLVFAAVWLVLPRERADGPAAWAALLMLALPILLAPLSKLTGLALAPLFLLPAVWVLYRQARTAHRMGSGTIA
jgi:hypothetical protein